MSLKLQPLLAALALAVAGLAATLPAHAASSASSASSEGSSASVGSSSTSIEKSSNSSSKGDKVAEGDYKVIQVADAAGAGQAGKLRLTLRATNDSGEEFNLTLPQEAAAQGKLAVGAVVTAKAHSYGLQFAAADTREPFFLVLRDEVYRELATKPVTL